MIKRSIVFICIWLKDDKLLELQYPRNKLNQRKISRLNSLIRLSKTASEDDFALLDVFYIVSLPFNGIRYNNDKVNLYFTLD